MSTEEVRSCDRGTSSKRSTDWARARSTRKKKKGYTSSGTLVGTGKKKKKKKKTQCVHRWGSILRPKLPRRVIYQMSYIPSLAIISTSIYPCYALPCWWESAYKRGRDRKQQTDRQTDRHIYTHGRTDGRTDGRTNGQKDRGKSAYKRSLVAFSVGLTLVVAGFLSHYLCCPLAYMCDDTSTVNIMCRERC